MVKTLLIVKSSTYQNMKKDKNSKKSTPNNSKSSSRSNRIAHRNNIMTLTNEFDNRNFYQNPIRQDEDVPKENSWSTKSNRTSNRTKRNNGYANKAKDQHINTSRSNSLSIINCWRQQMPFILNKQHLWLMLLLWSMVLMSLINIGHSLEMTARTYPALTSSSAGTRYSQLLSTNGQMSMNDNVKSANNEDDDMFRPFVPKDPELISRSVFTPSGQFRVFQPIDTDLRSGMTVQSLSQQREYNDINKMSEPLNTSSLSNSTSAAAPSTTVSIASNNTMTIDHKNTTTEPSKESNLSQITKQQQQQQQQQHNIVVRKTHEIQHELHGHHEHTNQHKHSYNIEQDVKRNEISGQDNEDLTSDLKSLEDLLVDYVTNFFEKGQYEPLPGLLVELQKNHSHTVVKEQSSLTDRTRKVRQAAFTDAKVSIDVPRTLATGRLLFLTGLKKVLWPVFMGLQVLKSLLIAMFIPAIIGSFTKLLGKGISSGSAPLFIRPMEPPQELDFRDNSVNFDDDNKFLATDDNNGPYAYNQPDASQMHNEYTFDPSSANNQLTFTRLGMNERQHQLMQDTYMSALQSIGSASFKNSGTLSGGSFGLGAPMAKKPPPAANTFQQFQKVPDSSLLLSNYDPFYSPLLSRLDSVFAQLKLNSDKEMCREKLICLMYANPAKYAPYSNLVSAQLSRELNELRKPTSDNPDILRFFKYMRAAKDGQDGVDCDQAFDKCSELKDIENPAMVSTYLDINKLVQARKLTSK